MSKSVPSDVSWCRSPVSLAVAKELGGRSLVKVQFVAKMAGVLQTVWRS